jgi:DNA gyrase subunit B
VLQVLSRLAPLPEDPAALPGWAERFHEALNEHSLDGRFVVEARAGTEGPLLQVSRRAHGQTQTFNFGQEFFAGSDYRRIAALRESTRSLIGAGAVIKRGERSAAVTSIDDVHAWLLSEARRGLAVQRYKGLGEINPTQLWETTLNKENRRLVRVAIEDAVAADQIFTMLMGEQVEPRRAFIEKNALLVSNLDL